jgi:hypothetical protein
MRIDPKVLWLPARFTLSFECAPVFQVASYASFNAQVQVAALEIIRILNGIRVIFQVWSRRVHPLTKLERCLFNFQMVFTNFQTLDRSFWEVPTPIICSKTPERMQGRYAFLFKVRKPALYEEATRTRSAHCFLSLHVFVCVVFCSSARINF